MVKICLIANCQVQSIELLLQHMIPSVIVWTTDFINPATDKPEIKYQVDRQMKDADFIIIQPGGINIYDSKLVKQQFPKKTLVIASLYFRGLHPDCCYVGEFDDRLQNPSLYHSVVVLDAYLQGRSEKVAETAFNIDNFMRLGLLNAWETSLDEMRRRDKIVDLPAADFIDQYCREFCGFLSMNHPSISCLHHYISAALQQICVPFHPMNLAIARDPLASQDIFPVHDFIAEYYHLPYRTTQHWMICNLGNKYLAREEYVRRFYKEYRTADRHKLWIHSPIDLLASIKSNFNLKHLSRPNIVN